MSENVKLNLTMIEADKLDLIFDELRQLREKVDSLEFDGIKSRWLTNEEVMEVLKVSKRTLQSYRDRGVLHYSQFGQKIYYKAQDINAHLERLNSRRRV